MAEHYAMLLIGLIIDTTVGVLVVLEVALREIDRTLQVDMLKPKD